MHLEQKQADAIHVQPMYSLMAIRSCACSTSFAKLNSRSPRGHWHADLTAVAQICYGLAAQHVRAGTHEAGAACPPQLTADARLAAFRRIKAAHAAQAAQHAAEQKTRQVC